MIGIFNFLKGLMIKVVFNGILWKVLCLGFSIKRVFWVEKEFFWKKGDLG